MASIPQYVDAFLQRQGVIAEKYGCDVSKASKTTRVLNKSLLVLLAVVVKTLVDKGVLTDAELNATLNSARDDAYADEPIEMPG